MASPQHDGLPLMPFGVSPTDERLFPASLVLSGLVHLLVLVSLFYANIHYVKQTERNMEIIYQTQVKKAGTVKKMPRRGVKSLRGQAPQPEPHILAKKESLPLPSFQDFQKQPVRLDSLQQKATRMPVREGKRLVSIPLLDSGKISNPKYLNYHEQIRNKIRNRAYLYVDNPQFDVGEVYLTFVLQAGGGLKGIQIIDEKTDANDYLRRVGLRSVKESSPFPPFPEDLTYPELSFNVIISFKVSEESLLGR